MPVEKDFKDTLDEMRRKSPAELSPEDLAFMKARSSYLTVDERITFGLDEQALAEEEVPKVPKTTKVTKATYANN
jgi:hypothetical protein